MQNTFVRRRVVMGVSVSAGAFTECSLEGFAFATQEFSPQGSQLAISAQRLNLIREWSLPFAHL